MSDITNKWIWFGFFVFIFLALLSDQTLLKKQARPHQSMQAAFVWSMVWILSALIFNLFLWIYLRLSHHPFANQKALDFLTGYIIEKSLSVDNLFAFYVIFKEFKIPAKYQQRIFSYGIWSAVILRLLLILLGTWLVKKFHWVLYLMGAFLFLTGIKMFFSSKKEPDLRKNKIFIFLTKYLRVTDELNTNKFFIRKDRLLYATPLFIALIFIEFSDLIFAFDSIPAIFAITTDPFIVWSSNIFAILGLRALYFILLGMLKKFYLLEFGIAVILLFVGTKMMIEPWIELPNTLSLGIILGILIMFTGVSYLKRS